MENIKISLIHFPELDSTNRFALEYGRPQHLLTVIADRQTCGRGRMGRSFFSPESGLYMSVILEPDKIKCPLALCTPAAALAVRRVLNSEGIEEIKIKWVNDLLLDGKKVCGILTQAQSENGKISRIIVGIGINLCKGEQDFPEDIRDKAGWLGFRGDKLSLAQRIAEELGRYICSDAADICREYNSHLAFVGEKATVTDYADGNRSVSGIILGADENCFLKIRTDDGTQRRISSGEIC